MNSPFLHFERLGLSGNPFQVLTREIWGEIAVLPPALKEAIDTSTCHIQLIGDRGRGKSSCLMGVNHYLKQKDQDIAYEYIPVGSHRVKTKVLPAIFLLDEVQRLRWTEKWRLVRQFRPSDRRLIFSTHSDLKSYFRGQQLITINVERMAAYDVKRMLERRLDHFRTRYTSLAFADDAIGYLVMCFGSDRRAMELFLYEVFQELDKPFLINAEYLRKLNHPPRAETQLMGTK